MSPANCSASRPASPAAQTCPYTGAGQSGRCRRHRADGRASRLPGGSSTWCALGRPGNASDPHGHGTHVAGSVLGDGSASGGQYRGRRAGGPAVLPVAARLQRRPRRPAGRAGGPVRAGLSGWRAHPQQQLGRGHRLRVHRRLERGRRLRREPPRHAGRDRGRERGHRGPPHQRAARVRRLALDRRPPRRARTRSPSARAQQPHHRRALPTAPTARSGRPTSRPADRGDQRSPATPSASRGSAAAGLATTAGSSRTSSRPERTSSRRARRRRPMTTSGARCRATRRTPTWAAPAWPRRWSPGAPRWSGSTTSTSAALEPSAALLKATLINGTPWLTAADSLADHPLAPNYHQGFGAVQPAGTIPNPQRTAAAAGVRRLVEAPTAPVPASRASGSVSPSTSRPDAPLRLCLTYTDLPGRALQNDLSLMVQEPTGEKIARQRRRAVGTFSAPTRQQRRGDPDRGARRRRHGRCRCSRATCCAGRRTSHWWSLAHWSRRCAERRADNGGRTGGRGPVSTPPQACGGT